MLYKFPALLDHALFTPLLKRSNWFRSSLALLLLVFVVGTVAYASHHHDKEVQEHHQVCEYCLGFAHLGAMPVIAITPVKVFVAVFVPVTREWITPSLLIQTVAQARAPPRLI